MPTGLRNSITDVSGLAVGHAHDERLASGVSTIICEAATLAAASVFGGGPGTRERDAIALEGSVGAVDALVLSGGSAFGLDAAGGVQSFLREKGRGFAVGPTTVPIVPQAILFDLLNGGAKDWAGIRPIATWPMRLQRRRPPISHWEAPGQALERPLRLALASGCVAAWEALRNS